MRLTTLSSSYAVVIKSGNLNFLEPSGPLQTCNGTALPLQHKNIYEVNKMQHDFTRNYHPFVFPFPGAVADYEKRLLASSCLSVRVSVRMKQLGSRWTDLH